MFSIEKRMYKYLVFEGNDGCGKSTIAKEIYDKLPDPKIYTKEPGSPHSQFCQNIREIIIHGKEQDLDDITYAHLFYADAYEHMTKIVKPAIYNGTWVVSDRSVLSNKAYWPQHVQYVHSLNHDFFYDLYPTIFYIDVPPEVSIDRITGRKKEINEFEREHVIPKIELIHKRYMERVLPECELTGLNHYVINNTRPIVDVVKEVWALVEETFKPLLEKE